MKKISPALIILIMSLYGCNNITWNNEVEYSGALKNVIINGDISAKEHLLKLKNRKNLYGLGAIGDLKGEIQIFNSKPFNTYVEKDQIAFDNTFTKSATILVYTQVKKWKEIDVPAKIHTRKQFEKYLEKRALAHGIDTKKPFPFLLSGTFKENTWHVINWDKADKVHSHKKHKKSGLYGKLQNENLDMIGFFSLYHTGIFTHHTTNMHIHFKSTNGNYAGHSDDFILGKKMILKLPVE